jgi:hypothetical protein
MGAPSLPLTVLDSAEPAAITFTSGLRHSFLATGTSSGLARGEVYIKAAIV